MIARVFDVSKVVALFSGGAVFYHEVTSLSFDWSIITGQRARRWPQIFYFGIKAVWWIYFFLNVGMVYSIKKPGDCRILMDTVEVCMGLIVTFASALLAVRTCVVYTPGRERKIVSAVLIFGVLVVLGFWLGGAGDVKMAWGEYSVTLLTVRHLFLTRITFCCSQFLKVATHGKKVFAFTLRLSSVTQRSTLS